MDTFARRTRLVVDLGLEACCIASFVIDRSSHLREFSGKLLLPILSLLSSGLGLRFRGFKTSNRLREIFP